MDVPLRTEKLFPWRMLFDLQIDEILQVSMDDNPLRAVSINVMGHVESRLPSHSYDLGMRMTLEYFHLVGISLASRHLL